MFAKISCNRIKRFCQDAYSGADFAKKEIQDEYGVVTGEYRSK